MAKNKQNPDAHLNTADINVMVTELTKAGESLLHAGEPSRAWHALDVASLYAADAEMSPAEHQHIQRLKDQAGSQAKGKSKNPGRQLKNRLLK